MKAKEEQNNKKIEFREFLSPRHSASPWVADEKVGLQIWKLPANILNKQLWTVDQESSPSLEVWLKANNLAL